LPRLNCTYAQFIAIIEQHGFKLHRQEATSHRVYRGVVSNTVQIVIVSVHRMADPIPTGTLQAMIRQSGLAKHLFRR
jgi:predicted RNA binding protein YcfA (HicA-like mRNA interferase family)